MVDIGHEAAIPNSALAPLGFLVMRSEIDEPGIPSGECSMLYFDERGVSRRYVVALRSDQCVRRFLV